MPVGLTADVQATLGRRYLRLESVFEIPDRRSSRPREWLTRAAEGLGEHGAQGRVVPFVDRAVVMLRPGLLGRALGIDVVAERVEDRPRATTRVVRGAHLSKERR